MKELTTLSKGRKFRYGVTGEDIIIHMGENGDTVSRFPLSTLVNYAQKNKGKKVVINASRTRIEDGTLGDFCRKNATTATVVTSYVAAIAVDMGLASPSEDRLSLVFK